MAIAKPFERPPTEPKLMIRPPVVERRWGEYSSSEERWGRNVEVVDVGERIPL